MPILDAEGRPIQSGSANKIYSRDDVRQIWDICRAEDAEPFALDLLSEGLTVEQVRLRVEEIAASLDRKPRRRVGGARG